MALPRTTAIPVDDERITTYGLVLEASSRLHRTLERSLKDELDLPVAVFELLLRLSRSPQERLTVSDLAQQLAITRGGVTRLVDRVLSRGLVDRRPCPHDGRVQWITLTDAGRSVLADAVPLHLDDLDRELFGRLTDVEVDQLRHLMDKLR